MSEEQQQEEIAMPGPGEILKKARQAAGLSAEDIAGKIRLKKALIEDIEQDNYDINISLTFIKGYLKLYAKQVSVSEETIVNAFEKLNTQKKEPAKLQSFSRRFSHQANDDKLMLVTYLIVAVVIALVVAWWFQQSDSETSTNNAQTSTTTSKHVATKFEEPADVVENQSTDTNVTGKEELDVVENAPPIIVTDSPEPLNPSPEPLNVSSESANISSESVTSTDNTVEESQTRNTEAANQGPEIEQAIESEVAAVSDAALVEVVFEFAEDCWMNLADATGENIAYGVKTKGRVMAVTGIPPFVVTLGAPEVVKISYAGQSVDMSFINPGRTAKFDLPLSE